VVNVDTCGFYKYFLLPKRVDYTIGRIGRLAISIDDSDLSCQNGAWSFAITERSGHGIKKGLPQIGPAHFKRICYVKLDEIC